jgi:transcriptional regulator with XRE-family HTH domain
VPPRLAGEVLTPLREVLERSGLSQSALARALNCDRRTVGMWVRGDHVPVLARREQIARVLGVEPAELWPDADRRAA